MKIKDGCMEYYSELFKNVDFTSMPYSDESAGIILQKISNMVYEHICLFQRDYYNLDNDELVSMLYSNNGDIKVIVLTRLRHLGELI